MICCIRVSAAWVDEMATARIEEIWAVQHRIFKGGNPLFHHYKDRSLRCLESIQRMAAGQIDVYLDEEAKTLLERPIGAFKPISYED